MDDFLRGVGKLDSSSLSVLFFTICAFLVPIVIILPPVPLQKTDALLQTHTLAGLAPSKSNLKKVQSSPAAHEPTGDGQSAKVQALLVYPVQSCRGVELTRARVGPRGFEHDNMFAFAQVNSTFPVPVDATAAEKDRMHSWAAITARQFPALESGLVVELWLPDEMKLRRQSIRSGEAFMILRFPWKERGWRGVLATAAAKLARGWRAVAEKEILLPIDLPGKEDVAERGYEYEDLTIGNGVTVSALNMSKELPAELRLYLGVSNKLALFRFDPARRPRGAELQQKYPLHIQNLASGPLEPKSVDLGELHVPKPQPNMLLTGARAHDEDSWKRIRLTPGKTGLYNDMPIDVAGGDHSSGARAAVVFHDSLREEDRTGWINVGMEINVDERTE